MDRAHANIAAFVAALLLLISTVSGYSVEQYNSQKGQADTAIQYAQGALTMFGMDITVAGKQGVTTAVYDTKVSALSVQLDSARALIQKSGHEATADDGYVLAYNDASTALSLANQVKADVNTAADGFASDLAAPLKFTVTPSQSFVQLYDGKTTDVPFILSSGDFREMSCDYRQSADTDYLYAAGKLSPSSSLSFSVSVQAPSSGSGNKTISVDVKCSAATYAKTVKTASILAQYQPEAYKSVLKTAKDAITTAIVQILSLDGAIHNAAAKNPGIDAFLKDAQGDLASANSANSQAEASIQAAEDSDSTGDPDAALAQANSALSYAHSANKYVTEGQAKLATAIQDFKSEGGKAKLAIGLANESMASAQMWIDRTGEIIENATGLGMDTKDQTAKVATANGLLDNSQLYLQNAISGFYSGNYAQAKIYAASSQNNSEEAEAKAKGAYESLAGIMQVCQTAHEQVLVAQSEISDADKTYTKLAAVVKNLPDGVDGSASAQDIETQRQKLDRAKNEYSDAQYKVSAGYCTQAVDAAIGARNDAADAKNLLGRVAERMKDNIVSALNATAQQAENAVESAKSAISDAGSTYGADTEKVAIAQKQLTGAQEGLQKAKTSVMAAKGETNLGSFLDKAAPAFDELRAVKAAAQESLSTANSAKGDAYTKFCVGSAAAIGAGGIGFMFWKQRKKGKKGVRNEKIDALAREGKFKEAARRHAARHEYKEAAELYAKGGMFDKASEIYRKLHRKAGKKRD